MEHWEEVGFFAAVGESHHPQPDAQIVRIVFRA